MVGIVAGGDVGGVGEDDVGVGESPLVGVLRLGLAGVGEWFEGVGDEWESASGEGHG